jgi:DNA (cytosine-5)-methyltransferase 1
MTLTVGSLFAGIGGIDLGLERAGMRTLWQVENNPYASAVLAKHWPDVGRFADVKDVGAHCLPAVDVLAGGFPCQDLSYAGKGRGIAQGTRSGLWFEFARIIRELRPRYVLVENVPALRSRGLHIVLADLAACGYDAEWDCIPAAAVGAHHRRDRIWLLAYPDADDAGLEGRDGGSLQERPGQWPSGSVGPHPDANGGRLPQLKERDSGAIGTVQRPCGDDTFGLRDDVADAERQLGLARGARDSLEGAGGRDAGRGGLGSDLMADPDEIGRDGRDGRARIFGSGWWGEPAYGGRWLPEPSVGRVAHGVPSRVDRLTALGNAVVPQVAEYIGRRIVEYEEARG